MENQPIYGLDYFMTEGSDFGHSFSSDDISRFYASQLDPSVKGYLNLGSLHSEELA